jgi:hypothetical protein
MVTPPEHAANSFHLSLFVTSRVTGSTIITSFISLCLLLLRSCVNTERYFPAFHLSLFVTVLFSAFLVISDSTVPTFYGSRPYIAGMPYRHPAFGSFTANPRET